VSFELPSYTCCYNLMRNAYSTIIPHLWLCGARGSVVGWGTMLQAGRSRVRFPMRSLDFSIYLTFQPPQYVPGVDSVSNRNEYQEFSWQVKVGRPARKADNRTPSVSRLSRECGNLDVSQPYGPPRPVTGIALPLFTFYLRRSCSDEYCKKLLHTLSCWVNPCPRLIY
jgi:hypothetical protein